MSMDTYFIRCALAAFAVFAGFQNILIAGSNSKRSSEVSDECLRELASCTHETFLPYEGLNNDEVFAKARAISLPQHCDHWSKAISCYRQKLRSEVCKDITAADAKRFQIIDVVDIVVNYVCGENFVRISGIYQCLLDPAIDQIITEDCKDVGLYATDFIGVCRKIPEFVECAAEAVADRCDLEAGKVARELGLKVLGFMVEVAHDRKCPPSGKLHSAEEDETIDLLQRYFFRKSWLATP